MPAGDSCHGVCQLCNKSSRFCACNPRTARWVGWVVVTSKNCALCFRILTIVRCWRMVWDPQPNFLKPAIARITARKFSTWRDVSFFFIIIIIYALRWVNMFRMSKRIAVYLGFCSDQGGGELHVLVCALKEWNQDFHLGLSKRTRFTLVEQLMSRLTNSLQFRRYVSVNLFMPAVLTQLAQCQRLWRDNCTGSTGWMGNRSSLARVIKKMHSSAALWNLSSSNRKASTPLDKLVLLLSF